MSAQLSIIDSEQPMSLDAPTSIIDYAIAKNINPDLLDRLFDLHQRVEAEKARKAFVEAMAAFKAKSIRIAKDKENKQYGSRYVSLPNLVNTVTPHLSEFGLSASWDLDQSDGIKITCILTHKAGHSERVSMKCPPDVSGAKNPIQQIKSAITYAKVCTFESVCGLSSSEGALDDDGNGAGGANRMPDPEVVQHLDYIGAASCVADLKKFYDDACAKARAIGDNEALTEFGKAKNKRYREIAQQ